jgi:SNF2 family DNA or RNA helicase
MSLITENIVSAEQKVALYHQCSTDEQTIMRVMAVIYQGVNQTTLNRILDYLLSIKAFGDVVDQPRMNTDIKNKLVKMGLLKASAGSLGLSDYLYHPLTLLSRENDNLTAMYKHINVEVPLFPVSNWRYQTPIQRERQIREAFYQRQYDELPPLLTPDKYQRDVDIDEAEVLMELCFVPYDAQSFAALPDFIKLQAFTGLLDIMREQNHDNADAISILSQLYECGGCNDEMKLLLAKQHLYTGQLSKAESLLAELPLSAHSLTLSGWLAFCQGDMLRSITYFEHCLIAKNKISRKKRQYIGGIPGIFYELALLKAGYEGDPKRLSQLVSEVDNYDADKKRTNDDKGAHYCLHKQALIFSGKPLDVYYVDFDRYHWNESFELKLSVLLSALCFVWQDKKLPRGYGAKLNDYFEHFVAGNQLWLAHCIARVLFENHKPCTQATTFLQNNKSEATDLYTLIKPKESWLQALDQLIALETDSGDGLKNDEKTFRLSWWLSNNWPHKLEAREQKRGKKTWTKGRVVSLKKLVEETDSYEYLTANDHAIIGAITKVVKHSHYGYGPQDTYSLNGFSALKACVGHPDIYFTDNTLCAIEIVMGEPELMITETGKGYKVFMPGIPDEFDDNDQLYNLSAETSSRYRLVQFNQKHRQIAEIVGDRGLSIPKKAKDKVLRSLKAVAPLLNIQSDIKGIGEMDTGIEQIQPDKKLYINIQPSGGGLQMECHVQPLGKHGPSLLPGTGNSMVVAQIEGKRLATTRDLAAETQQVDLLMVECPLFNYLSEHLLVLDDLEDALSCLELLELVQSNDNEPDIVVQWPKGQAVKLSSKIGHDQMKVTLNRQKDWFALEGKLAVDDDEVIDLKQLLTLVEKTQGRFIPLGNDKFLALTEQLKQQLSDIAGLTVDGKFHALAAPVMDEAVQGMKVKTNKAWQQQLKRLKESFELIPKLPATLQADLRDYQKDGYDWACRLSHWGAGACLADDMGLGKTLQALAVMVARAANGPTLVIAPLSVCFNWVEEALRFAPTLSVKLLGEGSKKERRELVLGAGPFDVVVCSYGLLQSEAEHMVKVNWHTMIADEAQAIKNPQAKRTQITMQLTADFKMITTGTPIENNLSELWSLFRFINPGLLGSLEQFNKRFAQPIENADENSKAASQALRKLISPFILRRLKSEVLTELPSRTQINLHVEQSKEEVVFYEALRQKAVENMMATDVKAGQKRIKILAEIMRLRRACCHPSLVDKDSVIEGSKLKVFDGLIDELKQGDHKALVFSQFVGHLAILKAHLIEKGVSFQYLDGSTTPANRKKAVNAFQSGEGDLFLISLKAGGAGLNLTAADYVIHMDPWWNPAVEDQASDRAHRMGQTRPVTIYRLITQNTIEDKIVELHQQKRDLAASLLEGTDSTGSLSLDDMMNLLKEQ